MNHPDFGELLPFYLDETDEELSALDRALLTLESDPNCSEALEEAFRMFHRIKGSAAVMGFEDVTAVTHGLEGYFDQIRSKDRLIDAHGLQVCFEVLDLLGRYHRELRADGVTSVRLDVCLTRVEELLSGEPSPGLKPKLPEDEPTEPTTRPTVFTDTQVVDDDLGRNIDEVPSIDEVRTEMQALGGNPVQEPSLEEKIDPNEGTHKTTDAIWRITIRFIEGLAWLDMKAQLIMSRLASDFEVVASDPPSDQLELVEQRAEFRLWIRFDGDPLTLKNEIDVDGVFDIVIVEEKESIEMILSSEDRFKLGGESVRAAQEETATDSGNQDSHVEIIGDPDSFLFDDPQLDVGEFNKFDEYSSASKMSVGETPRPPVSSSIDTSTAVSQPTVRVQRGRVSETLRIDTERLDQLMNLTGELVISKARFTRISEELNEIFRDASSPMIVSDGLEQLEMIARVLEHSDRLPIRNGRSDRWAGPLRHLQITFEEIGRDLSQLRRASELLVDMSEALDQLNQVSDRLQKGVLETRMVPIGPLFDRFHRVIRDLTVESGKKVRLELEGESTELDKRMIDELSDPLIHLVRNAVDHGLEVPEERQVAGKALDGVVRLRAAHRGNSIVVTVSDDGRGIDAERLRSKIIEHRLLDGPEAQSLEDRQLWMYVCHPGLSTAKHVTDVSGRGVGMDIVRDRIEQLNGTLSIRSEPGRGTTFEIRLPLTLAILPSLMVRIHGTDYAVPVDAVDEIVELSTRQVQWIQGQPVLEIRGRFVPLVDLAEVFGWTRAPAIRSHGADDNQSIIHPGDPIRVVVAHTSEASIGLRVDTLIGLQEIVLKSIERHFRAVPGLSGASIMGDGRVSLILDIDAIIEMASTASQHASGRCQEKWSSAPADGEVIS